MQPMSTPTITVHPNPLWRSKADYVAFAVVSDDYEGSPWHEQMAGRLVSGNRMEVCCIPLAVHDLSLGDIVRLVHRDGSVFIDSVVERSSWHSYRLRVDVEDATGLEVLLEELAGEGVVHEMGRRPFVGIAAQGDEAATRLVAAMERLEAEGRLEWESAAT